MTQPNMTIGFLLISFALSCGGSEADMEPGAEPVATDNTSDGTAPTNDVESEDLDVTTPNTLTPDAETPDDGLILAEDAGDALPGPDADAGTAEDTEEDVASDTESQAETCGTDQGPTGYAVGETLAEMTFSTCAGDSISTHDLCGSNATWLFIAHAWCTECKVASGFAEEIAAEYGPLGVSVIQLLVHSADHQLPTKADCTNWKDEYNYEETLTWYDPVVKNILLAENMQTGLSIFLDENQTIVRKDNLFVKEEVTAELDGILGQ